MTIEMEVDGIRYTNFTSASVEVRLDALANTFSFSAVSTEKTPLPFRGGEACLAIVDAFVVANGFIEIISGGYDAGQHTIEIRGRDKTGDLIDSNISKLSDLNSPITLKEIIEIVVANVGLKLTVIDEVNPDPFNAAEDLQALEPGDNAYQVIEELARKRQVLLSSNSDGNIVIIKSPGAESDGILQNILGATDNNIIAASYSFDQTGRFNVYQLSSQLNPTAVNNAGKTDVVSIVNQSAIITDAQIRAGRQMVLTSEGSYSDDQNSTRARWEQRIREARGRVYTATVEGYKPDPKINKIWDVNTLITIDDEFAQIDTEMLINSVAFSYGLETGNTTLLSMVERNAYQLQLNEPQTQDSDDGF